MNCVALNGSNDRLSEERQEVTSTMSRDATVLQRYGLTLRHVLFIAPPLRAAVHQSCNGSLQAKMDNETNVRSQLIFYLFILFFGGALDGR